MLASNVDGAALAIAAVIWIPMIIAAADNVYKRNRRAGRWK